MADDRSPGERLPNWAAVTLAALAGYRIIYHSIYLRDVPFALATFSDGRLYEQAALDILAHPPLGSQPFYLQGIYAYFLALPMTIKPWPSLGLLLQLLCAALTLYGFFWAAKRVFGRYPAALGTMVLMAYAGLAFYENKYLTAELGIACNMAALVAFVWALPRPSGRRLALFGFATGLAVLARPNMLLALPFSIWAVALLARRHGLGRGRAIAMAALGVFLALAPMALRNQVVTGHATIFPVHGGGTSFYIGNNPDARGVWNPGGLLSGQVTTERSELAEQLGVADGTEAEQMQAIGRALYKRSFAYMRAQPGHWLKLEARKVWLALGNDELAQDYDFHGEKEMLPWAHVVVIPFGVILALGVLGGWVLWRRSQDPEALDRRAVLWVIFGQLAGVLVANVVYFTSAQHRLPLAVPLAFVSGPAILAVWERAKKRSYAPSKAALIVAALLLAQAFWPRSRKTEPSAVHYYNLAVVQDWIGYPVDAVASLDRALELRPDHPVMRIERAKLRRRLGGYDEAREDLNAIEALGELPGWLRRRVEHERRLVSIEEGRRHE